MITRAQITRKADEHGVTAVVVERDYVLAHVVALIAGQDAGSVMVFKGGTSLRLTHLEEYRYSADLDYSIVGATVADAYAIITSALEAGQSESIPRLSLTDGTPRRISYRGPLGRDRELKLDLADDEVVFETEKRKLIRRWDDLPDIEVSAYSSLEIASEKLRCVLQRLQCRDLLDLDILFGEMDVDPSAAADRFADKAKHRGFDPTTFATKYEGRVPEYRRRWEQELAEYVVQDVPHFIELERRVRRFLRTARLV